MISYQGLVRTFPKYPAWVFELYARYFELLAPGEEALSIDEYAECLGFKGDKDE
ncbi:hypothetical protein MAX26_21610 [Escherichia coli]|jgi:hypothetical protein